MNAKDVIRIGLQAKTGAFRAASQRFTLLVFPGELDDQDGVLRRQPDEHDQPDLRKNIVDHLTSKAGE